MVDQTVKRIKIASPIKGHMKHKLYIKEKKYPILVYDKPLGITLTGNL